MLKSIVFKILLQNFVQKGGAIDYCYPGEQVCRDKTIICCYLYIDTATVFSANERSTTVNIMLLKENVTKVPKRNFIN